VPEPEIQGTHAVYTIIGGKVVWQADGASAIR